MKGVNKIGNARISDHMVFIGLGLAAFYWLVESFMLMLDAQHFDVAAFFVGKSLEETWPRLVVLCLFVIFGSHAQYTMNLRRKAEDALRESEERYRDLVDNLSIGIVRTTAGPNGEFLMANPAFLKMLGLNSEDELKKMKPADMYARMDEKDIFTRNLMARGSISWLEIQFKRKDGSYRWGLVTARLATMNGTDFQFFDYTIEDISERKKMAKKIKEDALTSEQFQKLLSPNLADMVVSGRLRVEKGGENRVATVFFADIRDFTAMSEKINAKEVLKLLNDFYEVVVEIVFKHGGTVDKFIGDSIMVIWGAPVTHADDPARSVRAALEIQAMIERFNHERKKDNKITVGIGVNTGNLVAGYIGSSRTMSYSVVGDTVNIAARLCSAASPGEILISEETYNRVEKNFSFRELDAFTPKGKSEPVRVFSVLGEEN